MNNGFSVNGLVYYVIYSEIHECALSQEIDQKFYDYVYEAIDDLLKGDLNYQNLDRQGFFNDPKLSPYDLALVSEFYQNIIKREKLNDTLKIDELMHVYDIVGNLNKENSIFSSKKIME